MDSEKILHEINYTLDEDKVEDGNRCRRNITRISEEVKKDIETVIVRGRVLSTSGRGVYNTKIKIDIEDSEILSTECECLEHQNGLQEETYFCKHVIAILLKYISAKKGTSKPSTVSDTGDELLSFLEQSSEPKEMIELEVHLEKINLNSREGFQVYFKIGQDKKYVLKNLSEFMEAGTQKSTLWYGKDFTFNPRTQHFSEFDSAIIEYVEDAIYTSEMMGNNRIGVGMVTNKHLNIPITSLRRFLKLALHKEIYYNGQVAKIVKKELPMEFSIKNKDGKYILETTADIPEPLSRRFDTFLCDGNIYLPSKMQLENLSYIYDELKKKNRIEFRKERAAEVFNNVLPTIKKISDEVTLDESVGNIVKEELKTEFYFDMVKNQVVVEVKLKYGEEILGFFKNKNKKIVIRDSKKEEEIKSLLESLNIVSKKSKFVFNGDDEALYNLFLNGYKKLEELGDVYYSDRFKDKRVYQTPTINAKINNRKDGFLDFNFEIEDIDPKEYKNIIEAFKENKRFYKLKDNSFINLESEETKDFLSFVDSIKEDTVNSNMMIHQNRAVVINELMDNTNLSFIKGREVIEDISKNIYNMVEKEYDLPDELTATLREYQVTGYKWLKNLSELGFGGILADEMGLGKTVQTIAFLLSERDKKSLVIAPTSLIYNWKYEFKKFAPTLRVGIVHGSKKERVSVIEDIDEYDVLLTTYGTLRNDEECYEKMTFDYCIIDEGQNIKNPLAQSSKSVKEVRAKVKFALTGTPIENNLMELWSIFDFIMPGYLFSGATFKKRFIEGENAVENLQRYIKPFMIRRLKKDVIKELPDKIEKKYYVELPKEQRKIYSAYVKEVKEKMQEENFAGDKITIFSYLTKLRQLCLDPSILIEGYNGGSGKIERALELINDNIGAGNKIILFSQFTSVLANIGETLTQNNISYSYLDGSTKASRRLELVDEFNKSDENKVFLISLKAGGTGLNLTSANIVIHFDPWWNPAIEEQATDRAHRIGQKNVVQVFKLIAEGTIEESILKLQEEKKELIDNVMSGGYEGGNVLSSLSKEEIMELFT